MLVTKHLWWGGGRPRLLRLTESTLTTHDPADNRETNHWKLIDVLSVERHGRTLKMRLGGACGACGVFSPQLCVSVPDVESAIALVDAVRRQLSRQLTRQASETHREIMFGEQVRQAATPPLLSERSERSASPSTPTRKTLSPAASPVPVRDVGSTSAPLLPSAAPRDAGFGRGSVGADEAASTAKAPEAPMNFEVCVTIIKARGLLAGCKAVRSLSAPLPVPPFFYSNPIVECAWGTPAAGMEGEDVTPAARCRFDADADAKRRRGSSGHRPTSAGHSEGLSGSARGGERAPSVPPGVGSDADEAKAALPHVSSAPVLFSTGPAPNDAASPRWGHESCFHYGATPKQLQGRRLVLRVVHARPLLPHTEAGRTQVCLYDIAVGPMKFDLPVHDGGGREAGRIVFTVMMIQKCRLAVSLPAATVTMRGVARHTSQASQEASARSGAFSLTAALTIGEEGESEPIRTEFDPASLRLLEAFNMNLALPSGGARSAIHVIASAKALETESLHLRVWRDFGEGATQHKPRLLGEVWLPVTKVYTPGDDAQVEREFSDVLWLHGQRIGRLAGYVRVHNGPRVVQLSGGFYTEAGIVPVGPIAAQKAKGGAPRGKALLPSHGPLQIGALNGDSDRGGPSAAVDKVDFEGPPRGLALPKEVEALLALVQNLQKLVLDLQRDTLVQNTLVCNGASGAANGTPANGIAHGHNGLGAGRLATSAPEMPHARSGREQSEEQASRRLQFLQARLQTLLGLSNKESCKAFFYASAEGLDWTQRLMLKLWSYLLTQAEHLPYRHQPGVFETLHMLMLRGELDHAALFDAGPALMERYSRNLWETAAYIIGKLNRKAAPSEVRVFCSQALSIAMMRLPSLRAELLRIVLPDGENRHKHVGEWNLSWSLQKSATHALRLPQGGVDSGGDSGGGSGTLPHTRSLGAALGSGARKGFTGSTWIAAGLAPPNDPWDDLWQLQPGPAQLNASVRPTAAAQERALGGKYWRERLRKRGHCFFLLLEHWVRHVPAYLALQPGETVDWRTVPGFPQLIKAFLLEMKQRPVHVWPESMRSCVCALVANNRHLMQIFARILLARVSPHHLRPTVAALKQLAQLMDATADEPLPLTFDYELLLQPLRLTARSQHFKVGACALIFVYNHVDKLAEPSRLELLQWLHSRFGWFALHWSRVVRSIFLHIVVMKVLHYDPAVTPPPRRHTPDTGLASSRSDPDIFATSKPLGLTSKASSASSLSIVREVEYARLIGDYQQSIHALQMLCDCSEGAAAREAAALLSVEEGASRAARSYACMAWEEFCALEKKWEELQEMLSKYHPDEPPPMSRSRNSSRSSFSHGLEETPAPTSRAAEQARPPRQPTLSMDAISDEHDDDDDEGQADEW